MFKLSLRAKPVLVFVVGMSLLCSGAFAQSRGGRDDRSDRGDRHDNGRQDSRVEARADDRSVGHNRNQGSRYHYRDGRWYQRGWFGWEFAVAALAIGVLVESLPPRHTTIVVGSDTYYYDDTRYYRQLPEGTYVVVQAPR